MRKVEEDEEEEGEEGVEEEEEEEEEEEVSGSIENIGRSRKHRKLSEFSGVIRTWKVTSNL